MTEVNSALKYKNGICEFGIEKKKSLIAKDFKIVQLHKHYWPENLVGLLL